jgi:hypothetical protein
MFLIKYRLRLVWLGGHICIRYRPIILYRKAHIISISEFNPKNVQLKQTADHLLSVSYNGRPLTIQTKPMRQPVTTQTKTMQQPQGIHFSLPIVDERLAQFFADIDDYMTRTYTPIDDETSLRIDTLFS